MVFKSISGFRIVMRLQWGCCTLRISIGSFTIYPFMLEWGNEDVNRYMLLSAQHEGTKTRALIGYASSRATGDSFFTWLWQHK